LYVDQNVAIALCFAMARKSNLTLQVGQVIRQLRLERNYSQEEFADICGVHRTYIGFVERGERTMLIETASVLAIGLGITLSQLFAEVEAR
jgi:transcriptional regulator with XRE-family HTH domain